jgi:hypothetical protein
VLRNPNFTDDNPAGELAPCGFGAFGTCCCTCIHRVETIRACKKHQGGRGACPPSKQKKGYSCTLFYEMARDKGPATGPILVDWSEHGMCEGYLERKEANGKS